MIEPGSFKSVRLSYGNGRQAAIEYFLTRGWAFESEVRSDATTSNYGDHDWFITFKAGVDAQELPKYDVHRNFYIL